MFQTIKNWFLYSSANPQEFSLTLKAGLPFLALLGLGKYTVDATTAIDGVANLLVLAGQFGTGAIALYGLLRKIFLTATVK